MRVLEPIINLAVCEGEFMSAATMEVLDGEAGDDRKRDAEVARLSEMFEAPAAPEPEIPIPGPGDFVIHRMGAYGTHLAFRRQTTRIN